MLEFLLYILSKCVFFCSSIGVDSFPPPLKKEEEAELLKRKASGDKEAKDKLIKHNLRLVCHVVKKYQGSYDNEDLISIGTIGLIKAINTYNENKGTQLATYTAKCIENEILMFLRFNKKYKNTVSLADRVGVDKDGNELTFIDLLSIDDDSVIEKVDKLITHGKFMSVLKNNLTDREFKVLVLRYGLKGGIPLCQREVAQALKISRSYISRIEKKAVEKLRLVLKNNNYFSE